jgi:hypothetical protein
MYRGFEALSGTGKLQMLVTCRWMLSRFLDEHVQQQPQAQASERAAQGTKRKAEDPAPDCREEKKILPKGTVEHLTKFQAAFRGRSQRARIIWTVPR